MDIEPINFESPDELRLGRRAMNGLPGRKPTKDIFGADVREPLNTFAINESFYVVLPHRVLNEEESKLIAESVKGLPAPVAMAETPNGSELTQTYEGAGIMTDQSAEFIGDPPPAEPTAEPPVSMTGDGSVPVSNGLPEPEPQPEPPAERKNKFR